MKIQNGTYLSALQMQDQYLNATHVGNVSGRGNERISPTALTKEGLSFKDILNQKAQDQTAAQPLKFSKHAANRLTDRNIELTGDQMDRLTEGAEKAGAKGIKESLVIVDKLAFIVNIPSKTVITAMDQTETKENVFTNIDGTVIM